jgi:hypothetical protein
MRQIAELSTSMRLRRRAIHSGYQNDHVAPQTCLTIPDETDTAEIDDDKSNDDSRIELVTGWARV